MSDTDIPRHSAQPTAAQESKALWDAGERLPFHPLARRFFCRTCGREEHDQPTIPAGWYSIQRHLGREERPQRLGVFCSVVCIAGQLSRFAGLEDRLGDRWAAETEPYRQR